MVRTIVGFALLLAACSANSSHVGDAAAQGARDAGTPDGSIPMACTTISFCCDSNSVPDTPQCGIVQAAGNEVFCSLVLMSSSTVEVVEPNEPWCPNGTHNILDGGPEGPLPCRSVCQDLSGGDPSYGPPTDQECKTLNACCSSITVAGGEATCGIVAVENSVPACASALTTFQGLGFCKTASSDGGSGS